MAGITIDLAELERELKEEEKEKKPEPKAEEEKRAIFHERDEDDDEGFQCPHCTTFSPLSEWTINMSFKAWGRELYVSGNQKIVGWGDTGTDYEVHDVYGLCCPTCGEESRPPKGMVFDW